MSPKNLRYSHNELLSLLKRVFEGLYGHSRDFEAMAKNVRWLETHGLDGMKELMQVLQQLDGHEPIPVTVSGIPTDGLINVDLQRNSLFTYAFEITDLFIDLANYAPYCTLEITNFGNPIALLPRLARCARPGSTTRLEWFDPETNYIHLAEISSGELAPTYSIFKSTLRSGKTDLRMSCQGTKSALQNPLKSMSSQDVIKAYEISLDNGIEIRTSDFETLCKIADRVLVEASESSRRGAGD